MRIDFDEVTRYYYWEEIENYKKVFTQQIFPAYKVIEQQTFEEIQKRWDGEIAMYGDDEGALCGIRDEVQYDEHQARLITYKALTMALISVCSLWEQQLFDYAKYKIIQGEKAINDYRKFLVPFYNSKGVNLETVTRVS